jgi:hypothetical protein
LSNENFSSIRFSEDAVINVKKIPGLWFRSQIGIGINDLLYPNSKSGSRNRIQEQENELKTVDFFQFCKKVCCRSGSALDPDSLSLWIRIELKCWIRILLNQSESTTPEIKLTKNLESGIRKKISLDLGFKEG